MWYFLLKFLDCIAPCSMMDHTAKPQLVWHESCLVHRQPAVIDVDIVTSKANLLGTGLGGTTAPLAVFIDFSVLSAKVLSTCKIFS